MIIILPTFEYTEGIKSFISIKNKSDKVFVSDASKDNKIYDLVKSDKKIKYIRNYPMGPIENWNAALRNITSEHILILHDDEYFGINDYNKLIKTKKNPKNIYMLNYEIFENSKKKNIAFPQKIQKFLLNNIPKISLFMNIIGPTAAYIFYHDLKNPHYYDHKLKWLVDVEFFYRISRNKNLIFLPYKVRTNLKKKSLTNQLYKSNFKIYFQEIWYLKKKYKIFLLTFIFYLTLSFIFRGIKTIINFFKYMR